MTVSSQEAEKRLPELLEKAIKGEEILISHEGVPLRLVPAETVAPSKRRLFGSAKGWFGDIPDDFDAPLEDLEEAIYDT